MNLCVTEKSSRLDIHKKLISILERHNFNQSDIEKTYNDVCTYQEKIIGKELGMQSTYVKTVSLDFKKTLKITIKSSNQRNFTDIFVTI